jgi:glycosyltransferase involved in cell wall biosynthesis
MKKETILFGNAGKRIVCVANLKKPKNHFALLNAFNSLGLHKMGWSLHLIGEDYKDDYSNTMKQFISINNLSNSIHLYGVKNDIKNILSQATIGVLVSTAEGFPVSLLEYGFSGLPTLSSNVGSCSEIIIDNVTGLLFDPTNNLELKKQLYKIVLDKSLQDRLGLYLHKSVHKKYSKEYVLKLLISKYEII